MKGKIMIRKGNENQEPAVVFVQHKNEFGLWVCSKLNTTGLLMSRGEDLIEFDFKTFKKMFWSWKIKRQSALTKNYEEYLEECS